MFWDSKAWTMLSISSLIFLLSFSITLIDGGNVVRWNRYGRRVEKWGVYPDSCYVSCNDKRLTSTLYVAENDEKCMSWANFVTRDYSTFNLMELTNWRHICTQKVIKLYNLLALKLRPCIGAKSVHILISFRTLRCVTTALTSILMETLTSGLELMLDLTSFKKQWKAISTKGVPTILL